MNPIAALGSFGHKNGPVTLSTLFLDTYIFCIYMYICLLVVDTCTPDLQTLRIL